MAPPDAPTDPAGPSGGDVVEAFRGVLALVGRLVDEDGQAVAAAHPDAEAPLAMLREALTEVGEAMTR